MDSPTHLQFASRLLQCSSGNAAAEICALLPQIDRVPAYFHRLYAHQFVVGKTLVGKMLAVLRGEEIDSDDYDYSRIVSDLPRMRQIQNGLPRDLPEHVGTDHFDLPSGVLAFVSHIYNDTFNNPVQAFSPYNAYPSGQWGLWGKIKDPAFRIKLYSQASISQVRKDFFSSPVWDQKFSIQSLTRAMIERVGELCLSKIAPDCLAATCEALDVSDTEGAEVQRAKAMLVELDDLLNALICRHSI